MLYVLLLLSLILCCVAATQQTGFAQGAPAAGVTVPALPPVPPSPVDTFRKILAMSQADREKFLATFPPDKRRVVMLKLEEYQALATEEREARLRSLQVRVYVRQLIRLAPSNRVERIALLAPADRELVQIRLAKWDQLSPDLQKEVLASEIAIRTIVGSPDFMFGPGLPPFPVDKKIVAQLQRWDGLTDARRTEVLGHFQDFVESLSEKEISKVMSERPEVAKTLNQINRLPKDQRERYMDGFKRFTALSPTERRKFLINASHWQNLTPQQRESWRVMAKKLTSAPPPPPLPSRPSVAIPAASEQRAALDSADPASR